jgi:hypothetical protein
MIHPATLLFLNMFICNAHYPPLKAAPSKDTQTILHILMNALHESCASVLRDSYNDMVQTEIARMFPLQSVLIAREDAARFLDDVSRDLALPPPPNVNCA